MSGTAGNGTWAHDNRFHDNSTGVTTDSFAGGHPGMPQDSSKWSHNLIYSNNNDLFNDERDAYCRDTPWEQRDPQKVCPTFQVPVGTGHLIAGGNANVVEENYVFDNWRRARCCTGSRRLCAARRMPARRTTPPPTTSYPRNCMGTAAADSQRQLLSLQGRSDPNGVDFWWDEEEGNDCVEEQPGCVDTDSVYGNCWAGNSGFGGQLHERPSGAAAAQLPRPRRVPSRATRPSRPLWSRARRGIPIDNTDPPGCDWFTRPSRAA